MPSKGASLNAVQRSANVASHGTNAVADAEASAGMRSRPSSRNGDHVFVSNVLPCALRGQRERELYKFPVAAISSIRIRLHLDPCVCAHCRLCSYHIHPAHPGARFKISECVGAHGSKPGSGWERFHARINDMADSFFYRLGYWVATHTRRTLFISLVLVIACCQGFANFRIEADGE